MADYQTLLQPVSAEVPGGPNLEYSPQYAELERIAAGKPERQVGGVVTPAEPPDWTAVIAQATKLLEASKDLRVAGHLARALARVHGFEGFADGLSVVRQLLDRFWDDCHPRIDPEDDNDPTSRINALATLNHRDTLQGVRMAPLFRTKAYGVVTLRDIDAAIASRNAENGGTASSALDGAFQEVTLEVLEASARAVSRCGQEAKGLLAAWNSHFDSAAPDFAELRRVLAQADDLMQKRLAQRLPAQGAVAAEPSDAPVPRAAEGRPGPSAPGEVRSRDDVLRALDAICAYYARSEPTSPVPLLLERSKRLVTMSFLDIVKDMMPDAISAVTTIAGKLND